MAVILPSRFAVLKVEGDEPDESKTAKKPAKTGSNSDKNSQAAKPKPKKKKKPAEKDGQRPPVLSKEDIFDEVAKDAKTILTREQRREDLKNKQPFLVEQVLSLQFQDQLDKKDEVIAGLRADVERLTAQLHMVKLRNKQLCTILGQGEMHDKAEILRDFEEVTQVKDELTQQVDLVTT
ncbi:G-kinase anchoring protein, putative [Ixodes scapularis]|uniref:G-kinase anchoring protein, putative n=1 Tax=Ixodes scapularis TaxID=6945 RepID=B7Q883_IXOSC|nr:G-kinase anchoring protein, putative [Ixodes scapularis]|eukprot:XP_002412314.1 G-kinase anchoring protein, putative [Ixodes scapularis]